MEVGQWVACVPQSFSDYDDSHNKIKNGEMVGRIAYIHPKGRYVRVMFEFRGGNVYESFFPHEVRCIKKKR